MTRTAGFNGSDYQPELDFGRLKNQLQRVKAFMLQHQWATLDEIAEKTGDPAASVSAQLRHLRKVRFGSYTVEKRRRGDPGAGLFEYRIPPAVAS